VPYKSPTPTQRRAERVARRKRKIITRIEEAPAQTATGLIQRLYYMPRELARRVKLEALDRDSLITGPAGVIVWPEGDDSIVRIKGASGVVAQILTDHFKERDEAEQQVRRTAADGKPRNVKEDRG
jgi:hypothetical protein